MKTSLRRWALLASSSVACFFLGELAIRSIKPDLFQSLRFYRRMESERGKFCVYDEALGWTGRPGAADDFEWVDCRSRVTHNALGFRGRSVPFERTGAPRWVMLGDSFLWGFGVEEREVFTEVLAARAAGAPEIVNLGVSGYGNDQSLLLWRQLGRRWRPDRVFLFVTLDNDLLDNAAAERYGYPKPVYRRASDGRWRLENAPVPRRAAPWSEKAAPVLTGGYSALRPLMEKSAWAALAARAIGRSARGRDWLEARGLVPRFPSTPGWTFDLFRAPSDGKLPLGWEVLDHVLEELAADARKDGSRLCVVLIPSAAQTYPRLWARLLRAAPAEVRDVLDPAFPNRTAAALARRRGAEVLDLLPVFLRAGRDDAGLYYPANGHWTAAGHRVAAEALRQAFPPDRSGP